MCLECKDEIRKKNIVIVYLCLFKFMLLNIGQYMQKETEKVLTIPYG